MYFQSLLWPLIISMSMFGNGLCTRQYSTVQKGELSPEAELERLLEKYKMNDPPQDLNATETGEKLTVDVNLYVYSLGSISIASMDYQLQILIRQRWTEPRLQLTTLEEQSPMPITHFKDKIWLPDLFFRNAKNGYLHVTTKPNNLLWLYSDGTIIYSQKVAIKLACPMELSNFPFDRQVCKVDIGSYGYLKKDVNFRWWDQGNNDASEKVVNGTTDNAIRLRPGMQPNEFDLTHIKAYSCSQSLSLTGAFACLMGEFHLERQLGFYIIYGFIPSILVVFISWISFLIDASSVPARTSIGLIGVLTLVTQSSAILSKLPPVSYLKAMDIWFSICLIFAVVALLEFAIVNNSLRKAKVMEKAETENRGSQGGSSKRKPVTSKVLTRKALMIDKFFFVSYPIAFIIFVAIFWVAYMKGKN